MPDINEQLKNVDSLPNPPHVVLEILEFSRNPDAGMQLASDIISMDPALAAKILKLVNSSTFSRGRTITTLKEALTNLGTRRILIVALGFSIKEKFPGWQDASGKSDPLLWQHSIATAVFARGIARLVGFEQNEQVFLCGLISRIGQLLLSTIIPDEYVDVIKAAGGALPSPQQERDLLSTDHHVAGRILLEKWELPGVISEVVGSWEKPKASADRKTDADEMAAIVHLADLAAELVFSKDKAQIIQDLHRLSVELLGVSASAMERLVISSQMAIEEALESFNSPLDNGLDCASILEQARQQLVMLSLGMATDLSEARTEADELQHENKRLEEVSTTDALTGIPNRHALELELDQLDSSRKSKTALPYAVMMIDVDHFKKFNDTYGHAVGDAVLREVGQVLAACVRGTDFLARYGGEEFCVILHNAKVEYVFDIADRFRQSIEKHAVPTDDGEVNVTASFGLAASQRFPDTNSRTLIEFADKALYEAKRKGRNCVVFADAEEALTS